VETRLACGARSHVATVFASPGRADRTVIICGVLKMHAEFSARPRLRRSPEIDIGTVDLATQDDFCR
jgi:hypothetical protein